MPLRNLHIQFQILSKFIRKKDNITYNNRPN